MLKLVVPLLVLLVAALPACIEPPVDESADAGPRRKPDAGGLDASTPDAGFPWPDYLVDGGYAVFTLEGWTIHLAEPLTSTQRSLGLQVVEHLDADLRKVTSVVPVSALPVLRGVPFWLEVAQPEFPGGAYHPSAQWLTDHGYPAAWAKGVMLGNAVNYLDWTRLQPAMVLHELAHAWHDQQLGFSDADVLHAYQGALDGGTYANVGYAGGGTRVAYGLNNEREYFAETSEAWFWRNDFQPFDRAELESFDPAGAALMRAKWPTP